MFVGLLELLGLVLVVMFAYLAWLGGFWGMVLVLRAGLIWVCSLYVQVRW